LLRIENISKSFGGVSVLKDFSLEIGGLCPDGRGEVTCLIGPNGAGKTTLVNIITGFQKPSPNPEHHARIFFKNKPILGLSPWQLTRKGIHRTWQGAAGIIHELTVLDNLILGMSPGRSGLARLIYNWLPLRKDVRIKIEETVSINGCEYLLDRLYEKANTLSYGWRKVLDVLRSTLLPGSLYIYDEPFSALDPEKLIVVERILRNLSASGKSILFIEHIRSEAMRFTVSGLADRMIAIARGKVISQGSPSKVLDDPEVVKAYTGADDKSVTDNHSGDYQSSEPDILKLQNICVSYGDINVIRDLKVSFKAGQKYLIVGPNGAGKSSLLKSITRAGVNTKGDIVFNGRRINDQSIYLSARDGIAYVPQEGAIFSSLKCADNILLAMPPDLSKEERESRLDPVFEFFPEIRLLLTKRAGTLSGGEAKKLALSMAMVRQPSLLLLDELSVGLDKRSIRDIYELVDRLHKAGMTIIIVEQNYQLPLQRTNYVIGLREGKLCFFDKPSSFTQDIQRALFTGAPISYVSGAPVALTFEQGRA
jgi:branched-chain amino acid transport system ATP-binding protein